MIRFYRRYKLQFYILMLLFFSITSFLKFYDYFTSEYTNRTKKGMDLFGGIIMAILVIIYIVDIIDYFKNKKTQNDEP